MTDMQLSPDIRPYWLEANSIQLGLDPRISTVLEGLTHTEFDFVTRLEPGFTAVEIESLATAMNITPQRQSMILSKLSEAGALLESSEAPPLPTLSRDRDRSHDAVAITHADQFGFAIGLALVRAGVGTVVIEDTDSPPPASAQHSLTTTSASARDTFTTLARAINPAYRPEGQAQLAVQTSPFLPDPFEAERLMAARLPHLLAWSEDIDVCVGPFVEPEVTACAECIYRSRMAEDGAWAILAPQALLGRSSTIPANTLDIAVSLAVRAVVTYLDGYGNMLANRQWRVPPVPGVPSVREYIPSPDCGCIGSLLMPDVPPQRARNLTPVR